MLSGINAIDVKRRNPQSVILFTGEPNETRRSGAVDMLLILGFLLGLANCYIYGAVLILHAISVVSRIRQTRCTVRCPQPALLRHTAYACCLLHPLRSARFRHVVDHRRAPLTSARYSRKSLSPLIATPPR